MLPWLAKIFAGGAAELIHEGGGVAKQIWGDQAERDRADADSRVAALNQFSAEFAARQNRTWWDAFVDGLNRLPRPLIALGVIALFVWCAIDPVTFAESMQALAVMPSDMWLIMGTVIGFFFLGRSIEVGKKLKVDKEALRTAKEIAAVRAARRQEAEQAAPELTGPSAAEALPAPETEAPEPVAVYPEAAPPEPVSAPIIDRGVFFAEYRRQLVPGLPITQSQVEGLELVLDRLEHEQLLLQESAYVLATGFHEADRKWQPLQEYGGRNKRYAPYYGRGLVQLTWKENYRKAGELLGIDLVSDPDRALDPLVSVQVLVTGMRIGLFTRVKLSDCWTDQGFDYVGARKIVNGTDRAELVAGYARSFEAALRTAGWPTTPASATIYG